MLKKALVVTSAAIALSAAASLPASANNDVLAGFNQNPTPVTTPEPMTVLGLMTFAGAALLTKKHADSQKAE